MKDIGIYFSNFGEKRSWKKGQIGHFIQTNTEENFYQPEKNGVALIFVPEYRNSDLSFDSTQIESLREQFYQLYAGSWTAPLYDLGTILPGSTVEDTVAALKDVIQELIKGDVFPIIVGGSQDLTFALYQAYEGLEQTVNLLDVDCKLDLGQPDSQITNDEWLNKIILHKPGYLFNYSLLGFQSYLVNPEELDLLDRMYFDAFRLGEFYSDNKMVEPLVRNADILSFDMNAIRSSDFLSNAYSLPHGLYGEDACTIMRYAGLSDKLTCLGLFNFQSSSTNILQDANLLTQMVWYFIEGYNKRKRDYPIGTKSNYTRYRVTLDEFKDEIVFYKSDKSGRWWMEVPYPKVQGVKFQRHLLVPCNYDVYQNALENEMPNLWWRTFKKLS